MNSYLEKGFDTRDAYLDYLACEYDIPLWQVKSLAETYEPDLNRLELEVECVSADKY